MKSTIFYGLFILCVVYSSCEHKSEPIVTIDPTVINPVDCEEGIVDFQNEVLPLLVSNCGIPQCHDSQTAEDDIIIDSYESLLFGAEDGLVVPNSPSQSDLYAVITENPNDEDFMPPSPYEALSESEISLIYNWISQGAENTICTSGCDMSSVTYSSDIEPIINTYCVGCHAGNSPSGELKLTNYTEVTDAVTNRSLWETIDYQSGFSAMPPNEQMNDCNVDKITHWINIGMPNN